MTLRGRASFAGNLVGGLAYGRWDEAMTSADEFIAECERGSPHILDGPTRLFRGYIGARARDSGWKHSRTSRRGLELARETRSDPQAPWSRP